MSLDDFEDMTDKLDAMGVVYVLMVCFPGKTHTRAWSNLPDFDPAAKRNMKSTFQTHMEHLDKLDGGEVEDDD